MRWHVLLVAALVLLALLALVIFTFHGQTEAEVSLRDDRNDLRNLAGLLLLRSPGGTLPMKDGALDVYALVRNGDLKGENLKVLRSRRSGTGPTDEEIERGDYANFPWERYRGDGKLEGPPFPLLWERKPDDKGKVLVALSDGTVTYAEPR